jgi:hypothetical protein
VAGVHWKVRRQDRSAGDQLWQDAPAVDLPPLSFGRLVETETPEILAGDEGERP